ncbi:MAG: PqqD family protein [Desulfatitalea sp.]|nr:PqqD family peptide modification chaperone [Desulfatitalea sp.]NNJ99280.1 PqqD family protein [Desulfatitalea sp.]
MKQPPKMDRQTLFRRVNHQIASKIDNEYLIMDIEQGSYFALRDVAGRIWELLETPHSLQSLGEKLEEEYAVDPSVCQSEVDAFLKELIDIRLICRENA